MKRYCYILLLGILLLGTTWSCITELDDNLAVSANEIVFNPLPDVATKGAVTSTSFSDRSMKISAYYNAPSGFGSSQSYFTDILFTKDGSVWKGSSAKYWPQKGSLNFLAYSAPALNPTVTHPADPTESLQMTVTDNSSTQEDILIAAKTSVSPSASAVALDFKHAEGLVVFQVQGAAYNATTNTGVTITDISVKDVNMSGTLTATRSSNSVTFSWSSLGSSKSSLVVPGSSNINVGSSATAAGMLLVPQQSARRFVVSYVAHNGKDLSGNPVNLSLTYEYIPSGTWESSKKYIYSLSFDTGTISISSSASAWTEVSSDVTIGGAAPSLTGAYISFRKAAGVSWNNSNGSNATMNVSNSSAYSSGYTYQRGVVLTVIAQYSDGSERNVTREIADADPATGSSNGWGPTGQYGRWTTSVISATYGASSTLQCFKCGNYNYPYWVEIDYTEKLRNGPIEVLVSGSYTENGVTVPASGTVHFVGNITELNLYYIDRINSYSTVGEVISLRVSQRNEMYWSAGGNTPDFSVISFEGSCSVPSAMEYIGNGQFRVTSITTDPKVVVTLKYNNPDGTYIKASTNLYNLTRVFSVSASSNYYGPANYVTFAPGNLQYTGYIDGRYFTFAPTQWAIIGSIDVSWSNSDEATLRPPLDLLGYATSCERTGYDDDTSCSSPDNCYKYDDHYFQGDLSGDTDWGYAMNHHRKAPEPGNWFTLSSSQWSHIFRYRENAANLYKLISLTNENSIVQRCIVAMPDKWTGTLATSYTVNSSAWNTLLSQGALVLPETGYYYFVYESGRYRPTYFAGGTGAFRGYWCSDQKFIYWNADGTLNWTGNNQSWGVGVRLANNLMSSFVFPDDE